MHAVCGPASPPLAPPRRGSGRPGWQRAAGAAPAEERQRGTATASGCPATHGDPGPNTCHAIVRQHLGLRTTPARGLAGSPAHATEGSPGFSASCAQAAVRTPGRPGALKQAPLSPSRPRRQAGHARPRRGGWPRAGAEPRSDPQRSPGRGDGRGVGHRRPTPSVPRPPSPPAHVPATPPSSLQQPSLRAPPRQSAYPQQPIGSLLPGRRLI